MRISNQFHLPQALVNAVQNDDYSRGAAPDGTPADISVTELISPARIAVLRARYEDELEEDVVDRIWLLLGKAVHTILERAGENALTEQRFYARYEGWVVSGACDTLALRHGNRWRLSDYKVTSVYKAKKPLAELAEWEAQTNVYAHLARMEGHTVDELEIVAILRDWRRGEAERDDSYPAYQVRVIGIPVWEPDRCDRFIRERVRIHQAARESLPLCTDDERWTQPRRWALMKRGGKRAIRLYDSAAMAASVQRATGMSHYVEERPGSYNRCAIDKRGKSYCPVALQCRAMDDGQWPVGHSSQQGGEANGNTVQAGGRFARVGGCNPR